MRRGMFTMAISQSQPETAPRGDARTGAAPEAPGDPARLAAVPLPEAPVGNEEPLDLTEQIDALLGEIESASQEADPWGDAAQRGADRAVENDERSLEPSQKLLAKVRAGDAVSDAGPEPSATAASKVTPEIAPASTELPEDAAHASPETLDDELKKLIAETESVTTPSRPVDAAPAPSTASQESDPTPTPAESSARSELAAELDAALEEASAALQQVTPPEDPPATIAAVPASIASPSAEAVAPETPAPAPPVPEAAAPTPQPDPASPAHTTAAHAGTGSAADAEALDAALAEQAEALVAEATPEATASSASTGISDAQQAAVGQSAPSPGDHSTHTAHSTQAAAPTPTPHTTSAAAHATHSTRGHSPANAPAASTPAPASPASFATTAPARSKPALAGLGAVLSPALKKLGAALALPLSFLPVSARDAVGYLAAVTLFNALAVWVYMLLVYQPAVPPPAHDAPALHSSEPAPKPPTDEHNGTDGHGTAAQKHGAPEPRPPVGDAEHPPKRDHAATPGSDHPEGHH